MARILNRLVVFNEDCKYECIECGFSHISRVFVEKHILFRHSEVLYQKRKFEDFDAIPEPSNRKVVVREFDRKENSLQTILQPLMDGLSANNSTSEPFAERNRVVEQLILENRKINDRGNERMPRSSEDSSKSAYNLLNKISGSCKIRLSGKTMALDCLVEEEAKASLKIAHLEKLWQKHSDNSEEKVTRSQFIIIITYLFVNLCHPKIECGKELYSCDFLWSDQNCTKLFDIKPSYRQSRCTEMMLNACERVKRKNRQDLSFFGMLKSSLLRSALIKIRDLYGLEHNYRVSAAVIRWFVSSDFEEFLGLEPFKL